MLSLVAKYQEQGKASQLFDTPLEALQMLSFKICSMPGARHSEECRELHRKSCRA